MDKQLKQNFIELPLNSFKKKSYPIPHFLFQTKLQKSQKNISEIKKLIQSQQYQYIGQISEQRNLYCCKQKTNDRLVVIQIKQVSSKNNKNIYLSINLTPALKKDIKRYFQLKNWKIVDKIFLQDQKGTSGLVMLEYNFVQNDLRNYIKRQLELDLKTNNQELSDIFRNIIENLCYYHLESTAILDIRPETILFQNNKWFILNGDYSVTNKSTQFGSSMSKSVGFKPLTCSYLSPLMYQSYVKNDPTISHNPYKSDVYSLGLIIWQLLSIGTLQASQIKLRLQSRKQPYITDIKQQKYFNFRQKIIIQQNNAYCVPNIFELMLQQNQDNRNYIIEICLCLNFTETLFSKILIPFQNFFKKQIIEINNSSSSNRKKIQYPHVGIQYEGDTKTQFDKLIRNGRGTIMHNNIKVFDGEWLNNLPHGKCSISFSQMWNYQGMLEEGKLNGQGILTFNGIRIGSTKWIKNLEEQKILPSKKQPQAGYYLIQPETYQRLNCSMSTTGKKNSKLLNTITTHLSTFIEAPHHLTTSNCQQTSNGLQKTSQLSQAYPSYKLYFQQLHNNKSKYVLNFLNIQSIPQISRLLQILIGRKMFLNNKPEQIQLYQDVKYQRYIQFNSINSCDMIRIGIKRKSLFIHNSQNNLSQSQNFIQEADVDRNNTINNSYKQSPFSQTNSKQLKKIFPHTQINATIISNFQQQTQYIDLLFPAKLGSLILVKLLNIISVSFTSPIFESSTLNSSHKIVCTSPKFTLSQLNLSYCSTISQDEFRDIIQSGVYYQNINLSKCNNLNDNAIKYLVQCEYVNTSLTGLNLNGLKITDKSLQELRFCDSLMKRLRYLNISYCQKLTNDKLAQFICDQKLGCLEELEVAGLALNHRGLEKIAQNFKLYQLKRLNVGACHQIGQITLLELIRSKQLSKLKSLQCYSTTIKDIFLQTLSNQEGAQQNTPNLQSINLSGSINLTVYGISKFFLSKNSKSITSLNLSNLDISDDFVELLGKRNLLNPNLTELNLSSCFKVSDKGIKQLLKAQRLLSIKKLDLSKTNISNDTLFLLSQSAERKLQIVRFYKCTKMNDTGFEKLLMSPAISKIKKLQIGGTSIKTIFFTTLASQKVSLRIEQLYINQCQQIDQRALCRLLSSKRISQIRILDISSTKTSGSVIDVIHKNPYLKSHLLQLITTNCINIKAQDISQICIPSFFDSKLKKKESMLRMDAEDLSNSSLLLKLSELELNNQVDNIQKLFSSSYIINLSKLQIKWQECSLSLGKMSQNVAFNGFKELSLLGSKFNEEKLIALIKSTTLKNLETFNLSWTDITNETLAALANSEFITSLRNLNLAKCNSFNDKGLVKFLMSQKVTLLLNLDLRSTLITNTSLEALGKSKNIKSLTKLILRSCPNISQIGFKEYFSSSNCSSLRQLDVGWTRVSGNLFVYISKSKTLQLNSLKISGLKGIEFQLCKFVSTISCSSLTQLEMNYSQISTQTLSSISNSRYFQTLQKIQILGYEIINDEQKFNQLKRLLQSANMSKLTALKISFNSSNDKGAISDKLFQIIQRNLHMMEKLYIIGASGIIAEKAKKKLKRCQIICEE